MHIHAPKPKNKAGRNLGAAITTGVILGAVVIAAVLVGPMAWYPLVAVAVAFAMWEVLTRLREAGYQQPRTLLIILGQIMLWSSAFYASGGLVAAFAISVLFLMFWRLFFHTSGPSTDATGRLSRSANPENYLRDTSVGIFVLTWIPLFGSFAAMISLIDEGGIPGSRFIIAFMLCVVASDVGGYAAGVMFGTHPMAPAVSPNKSWEGFAGSMVFGMITGLLVVHFLIHGPWWLGLVMGAALVVCATMGDLVESQFKRELGIKDMSNLLPGHGGLMDRLDGMLPAACATYALLNAAVLLNPF
ncbi:MULTISPECIES: phosphatidate cytidylyltransferase [Corynebacterium]|uniref:Phosphatidate cytidylyltransferase n=1 Tax=Corynebacterium riegelii TaxID=156976 RepID=A0A0K1R9S3_9CORY|nr:MULTISPECIES: phosphatidate cytidylyltransferase [Corynebacterium]AKV58153.1 CDP-diglyceride synthetase [Corynebacterium riegelii]MDK7179313.1 phosphatidate cytidylyltransferase [Corynebacterium riegelii]OFT74183.1 CDP-diglyceride synthetase [Corynebacterium sp. HMSC30G07]PLA13041.1 phosphatidate cytidylyltransferase [Corynebacterium riegelii]QQU85232.1 phosphatidate cytidylyltransferase [Corynebacterium riegelii]